MVEVNDVFTGLESVVRFSPCSTISFISEEVRRYGIKTNKETNKGKTIFFQSSHIIAMRGEGGDENTPLEFGLVSFKDLFKLIGKNSDGVDKNDIVRIKNIAEKLEDRNLIQITGVNDDISDNLNEQYDLNYEYDRGSNVHHIMRNDKNINDYVFRSKFSTNKIYPIPSISSSANLIGIGDFFLIME